MPQVYFKPITWYIKMHHVRRLFLCGVMAFSYYMMFIHNLLTSRTKLTVLFVCHKTVSKIWPGQIWSGFLDTFDTIKRAVSFPVNDKYVVNEHHVIRKSHDATEKKMSSRGAFQCTTWMVWNNSWYQKRYSEGGKKIRGCPGLLGRVILLLAVFNFPLSSYCSHYCRS